MKRNKTPYTECALLFVILFCINISHGSTNPYTIFTQIMIKKLFCGCNIEYDVEDKRMELRIEMRPHRNTNPNLIPAEQLLMENPRPILEEKPKKYVRRSVMVQPGETGMIFNDDGMIIEFTKDVQEEILNIFQNPGWKIIKIGEDDFSWELLQEKSTNSLQEFEITAEYEEEYYECIICFNKWLIFDVNIFKNPICRHDCCLGCFFKLWKLRSCQRKCFICRGRMQHPLLEAVAEYNMCKLRAIVKLVHDNRPNFDFEISIIYSALDRATNREMKPILLELSVGILARRAIQIALMHEQIIIEEMDQPVRENTPRQLILDLVL